MWIENGIDNYNSGFYQSYLAQHFGTINNSNTIANDKSNGISNNNSFNSSPNNGNINNTANRNGFKAMRKQTGSARSSSKRQGMLFSESSFSASYGLLCNCIMGNDLYTSRIGCIEWFDARESIPYWNNQH